MSLASQLKLDKIAARQHTQKQIPCGNLGYSSFSYNLFKKRRKNGLWIAKRTNPCNDTSGLAMRGGIRTVMVPDGAARSHHAVLTYNGYRSSSYIITSLVAYILFFKMQGFCLTAITRYFWHVLYSSLIITNGIVMSAMISRYTSGYVIVIATIVLVFLKLLQIPKFLLHCVSETKYTVRTLLISTIKCVKKNQLSLRKLHNETSAAPNWKLISEDDLFTVDIYSIEGFCISLGILLIWRLLCRLFFYVGHRFYCKNDRK